MLLSLPKAREEVLQLLRLVLFALRDLCVCKKGADVPMMFFLSREESRVLQEKTGLRRLNKEWGQTIILVTHDVLLSKKVQRVAAIRDGKISSERILKETYTDVLDGASAGWDEETQDEFAIIDRAGRVQIPREFLETMNLEGNKVRMSIRDGRITLEK